MPRRALSSSPIYMPSSTFHRRAHSFLARNHLAEPASDMPSQAFFPRRAQPSPIAESSYPNAEQLIPHARPSPSCYSTLGQASRQEPRRARCLLHIQAPSSLPRPQLQLGRAPAAPARRAAFSLTMIHRRGSLSARRALLLPCFTSPSQPLPRRAPATHHRAPLSAELLMPRPSFTPHRRARSPLRRSHHFPSPSYSCRALYLAPNSLAEPHDPTASPNPQVDLSSTLA